MCLILFAYQVHPDYPLIVAANRDEFYSRPTAQPAFWEDQPTLFAGRDLQAGGTWMGLNRNGRFAAITNYREGTPDPAGRPSRGELCTRYLSADDSVSQHLQFLQQHGAQYAGFNLLLADFSQPASPQLGYYSNRSADGGRLLSPGIYGLSNGLLNDPWPKVSSGKQALQQTLQQDLTDIQQILLNDSTAPPAQLPDTGIDKTLEEQLSSRFIAIGDYGTRSSTVLRIDRSGKVEWLEQNFDQHGATGPARDYTINITG